MKKTTPETVVASEPRFVGMPISKLLDSRLIAVSFRAAMRDEYSEETSACLREILERRLFSKGKMKGLMVYEIKPMQRMILGVVAGSSLSDAPARLEVLHLQRTFKTFAEV